MLILQQVLGLLLFSFFLATNGFVPNSTLRPSSTPLSSISPSPTKIEQWAITDNIKRFVVETENSGECILWRGLVKDVLALNGRSPEEVIATYASIQKSSQSQLSLLPVLNNHRFKPTAEGDDCLTGNVCNLNGIADESEITTNSLVNAMETRLRGYVIDEDDRIFELGNEYSEEEKILYFPPLSKIDNADNLANIAKLTGLLIVGCGAINLFGHHLSVNIFWV